MARRLKNIDGWEKVSGAFDKLPTEAVQEITHALNLGGKEIADTAKQLVPVKTGATRRTIRHRIEATKKGAVVKVVAGTTKRTAITARVIEFGRRPGPGRHRGLAKRPFMWPAYWHRRKRVRGRVDRAIRKAVKEALARG